MKRKIALCSIGIVLLCVVLLNGLTSYGTAAASEWFPSSSTQCDYQLSWILTYRFGTSYNADTFKVYNKTGDNSIWIVPTSLNAEAHAFSSDWVKIANDVPVVISNVYDEKSATTLNRSIMASFNGTTNKNRQIYFCPYVNSTMMYQSKMNMTADYVQKSGYYTWATNFLDYIDCSLNPGQLFRAPMRTSTVTTQLRATILTKTPNYIIASWIFASSGVFRNGTYLTDLSGQVVSFSEAYTDTSGIPQVAAYCWTYSRISSGSNIPGYEITFLLIASILGGCIIFLVKKRKLTN